MKNEQDVEADGGTSRGDFERDGPDWVATAHR